MKIEVALLPSAILWGSISIDDPKGREDTSLLESRQQYLYHPL
jgi:hypothetical protein